MAPVQLVVRQKGGVNSSLVGCTPLSKACLLSSRSVPMLWHPTLSTTGFKSRILDTDELSTGKWIMPIPIPDIGLLWEEIEDAACEGRLLAVKKSTDVLGKKLGHHLACVYCASSDADSVREVLMILRELGVEGELRYKSDRATFEFRDQYLWSSSEIENLTLSNRL